MQTQTGKLIIRVSDSKDFSWPVKVRVRVHTHPVTPRKSPTFPAGLSFTSKPKTILRTLELPQSRPCRRANAWSKYPTTKAATKPIWVRC